jgi:NAD(P)-dependent dehydrogenase (short-subunit alcohol dehydrogenase family)
MTQIPDYPGMLSLGGRVALVTGSGGGIGRTLAIAFMQAGASIALHDRGEEQLTIARGLLDEVGGAYRAFTADMASVDECRRLVREVHEAFGRIDILVNCAGTAYRGSILDATPEAFDRIVAVNQRAPFFLSQAVQPIMKAQGGGKILHIGSLNSSYGLAGVSVYGQTKGAISQMAKTMAAEWAPDNIQVNCLAPGIMITPINEEAIWGNPRKRAWIMDRTPAGRPGMPDDLVGAALLLVSAAGDFITGQTILVDGGFLSGGSWDYQGPLKEEQP